MLHRRDFMGSGLLAGLFLSVPALAGKTGTITGRVEITQEDDNTWLSIYLTNHGDTPDDIKADSGHAMLEEEGVKIDGHEAWIMQMGMMSRMGPRIEWMALAPGKEMRVGRYFTALVQDDATLSKSPTMTGKITLTLRSGPLTLDLAAQKKSV